MSNRRLMANTTYSGLPVAIFRPHRTPRETKRNKLDWASRQVTSVTIADVTWMHALFAGGITLCYIESVTYAHLRI